MPPPRAVFEKIVVVTRHTALEELVRRFNTRDQARFYIESLGENFAEYEAADRVYSGQLAVLRLAIPPKVRVQYLERDEVPTYSFGPNDLVVTLGADGLVVNVAKYLTVQPLLAFNPDPQRIDGVLIPFGQPSGTFLVAALQGELVTYPVTMAQAELNDGQRLLAVNDFFIGAASHVSARYRLGFSGHEEDQSSSGIIVSTGAGSTGWYRSVATGALRLAAGIQEKKSPEVTEKHYRLSPASRELVFSVREPFESRVSSARLVHGRLASSELLTIASRMPQNGVIFSDGVETDYLAFNSGAIARVSIAPETLKLLFQPHQPPQPSPTARPAARPVQRPVARAVPTPPRQRPPKIDERR